MSALKYLRLAAPFAVLAGARASNAGPGAIVVDPNAPSPVIQSNRGAREMEFRLSAASQYGKEGDVIKLAVTPADTSDQNKEIDTWLGGYSNFGYLADYVSPVVLVDQEKARRRDFKLENVFEVVETRTGRYGAINEIEHLSETLPYETEEHALSAFIPYAAEAEAVKVYNVKQAHAQTIADKLALAREVRVFNSLTTLANWNTLNRTQISSGTLKWNGGASSDPLLDLHTRIQASASPVSAIVMNGTVGFHFLAHNKVQAYMKQHLGDERPDPNMALSVNSQGAIMQFNIVGYPPIVISAAKKWNKATSNLDLIMGNDVLLLSQPQGSPVDGTKMVTHVTFRTKGRSGTGWTTNEYIPQSGRGGLEKGTMQESGYKETNFFGSNRAGGLIKDVLA